MRRKLATYYDVLGLPPGTSVESLHKRYLDLAWEFHTDRGGDYDKMTALTAAWAVLKDQNLRRQYDAVLRLKGMFCRECDGNGSVTRLRGFGGNGTVTTVCRKCGGTGVTNDNVQKNN